MHACACSCASIDRLAFASSGLDAVLRSSWNANGMLFGQPGDLTQYPLRRSLCVQFLGIQNDTCHDS